MTNYEKGIEFEMKQIVKRHPLQSLFNLVHSNAPLHFLVPFATIDCSTKNACCQIQNN